MRDVAARAGVGLKTVSRVVNREAGVSAELAERVVRAVEELDFRPNAGASNLRRGDRRTATVGLLVEDVANPFSSAIQRAVEDAALPRGFIVFSASLDEDAERERRLTRTFSARRADGLVLVPSSDDQSYLAGELRAGTSIVCVDRMPVGLPVDVVLTTNRVGSREGVRHLLAAGHTRVAFLGARASVATSRERYEGYCDALEAAGLPLDPALAVRDLRDVTSADGAATSLLARPDGPTALFTAQNAVTMGALRALRRLARERSVALVGFDDFPLADLLVPAVTVVAQDPSAIGRVAAEALFRRIGGDTSAPEVHLVPTTLVRRGSGEIPPPGR
jgi:LacI family transcriptional regulator